MLDYITTYTTLINPDNDDVKPKAGDEVRKKKGLKLSDIPDIATKVCFMPGKILATNLWNGGTGYMISEDGTVVEHSNEGMKNIPLAVKFIVMPICLGFSLVLGPIGAIIKLFLLIFSGEEQLKHKIIAQHKRIKKMEKQPDQNQTNLDKYKAELQSLIRGYYASYRYEQPKVNQAEFNNLVTARFAESTADDEL